MIAVRVMQVSIHQVIDVISVRDGGVAAIGSMLVPIFMTAATVLGSAGVRIGGVDGERVLFDLAAVLMMQAAVVQIIDVAIMLDAGMTAIGAVLVAMIFVMFCHVKLSYVRCGWPVRQFDGMGQGVQDKIGNVPIREGVVKVITIPATDDQPFAAQDTQPLGDCGELVMECRDNLGDAHFLVLEQVEDA